MKSHTKRGKYYQETFEEKGGGSSPLWVSISLSIC